MVDPIIGRNLQDVERVDTLKAADVVPVLRRVGAPLMMCVNAADATKVVLGGVRVELVNPELIGALGDVKSAKRHGCHNCAATPTIRAVATPGIDHTVRKVQQQLHRTAVTSSVMLRMYNRAANTFEPHFCCS